MAETLIDVLHDARAIDHKGYTFLDSALKPTEWTFKALSAEADRRARVFFSLGLKTGDRVAMVIPEGETFVLSFFGLVRAGMVPVPMYPPLALGQIDSYAENARRIMDAGKATALLTTKQVAPLLWGLLKTVPSLDQIIKAEDLEGKAAEAEQAKLDAVSVSPDDLCFLQFTSGSTASPKGVIVTHRNLIANAHAIMFDGLNSDKDTDKGVSWLPLYHDMGLIGFVIAPIQNEIPVVFIPTLRFIKSPRVWLDTIHKYRGTITFAPNFAFGLAAKRATDKQLAELDLSCLRVLGCGAEPINPALMRQFVETFAPVGFKEEALMPAYGMAEATLAISFDSLEAPIQCRTLDREQYETEKLAVLVDPDDAEAMKDGYELVSCGRTFPKHEVGIMHEDGSLLSEGQVGEIVVKGPSITTGYFENPEASENLLEGGWLHTGDLGFTLEGNLYISGRLKDVLIINGRNYHPQSVEWEIEQIDGVRKGNVVAFATDQDRGESFVIVAELRRDATDEAAITEAIRRRVQDVLGIVPDVVELLAAGRLPKTSSGKLQRAKTKQFYQKGLLHGAGSREMGSNATRLKLASHVAKGAVAKVQHSLGKSGQNARRWAQGLLGSKSDED